MFRCCPASGKNPILGTLELVYAIALLTLLTVLTTETLADENRATGVASHPANGTIHCRTIDSGWTLRVLTPISTGESGERVATVPSAWESFVATDFDGVAEYRRVFTADESAEIDRWLDDAGGADDQLLRIAFDGVATEAMVFCNGTKVGEHLGGWTPWTAELNDAWVTGGPNEIVVRVDEKVGHHTQGFLPVFAPHFGGIWQPVRLEVVPAPRILTEQTLVTGRFSEDGNHTIDVDIALSDDVTAGMVLTVTVEIPRRVMRYETATNPVWEIADTNDIHQSVITIRDHHLESRRVTESIPIENALPWSPETPWLYPVNVVLYAGGHEPKGKSRRLHQAEFRTGIRAATTHGHQLLLNGQPIILRGLLNWGYAPPSTAPSIDPEFMLDELRLTRRLGLNMMKFCLWIPPKRYLELADEMGILAWVEYPTWHAQLTTANLAALEREYTEFTDYDRNHPSVILRSLTCETGPSAELSVIQSLYDLVHRQVPGGIVEDDSSWISWNRVSDLWDDHPYGNNHTWVDTLSRLRDFIAEREAKPLVLGEAIAADTWPDLRRLETLRRDFQESAESDERPFWLFGFYEAAIEFEDSLRRFDTADLNGPATVNRLRADSIRYAELMRKYQIETFRREVPWGGFMLSVIRDFPFAAMGLVDSHGEPKFADWDVNGQWSADDPMLVMETADDRRSFWGDSATGVRLLLATAADAVAVDPNSSEAKAKWELIDQAGEVCGSGNGSISLSRNRSDNPTSADHYGSNHTITFPKVDQPRLLTLRFETEVKFGETVRQVVGQWPIWVLPPPPADSKSIPVVAHASISPEARGWLDQLAAKGSIRWVDDSRDAVTTEPSAAVIVAGKFDSELLRSMRSGAKVMMFPDGGKDSLPSTSHWFLRGGPVVFNHPMLGESPEQVANHQDMLVDLQHFDLGSNVQHSFDYWQQTSPILMLWDNHDIKEVKTHGLLWEASVDQGRVLVSMLNHDPERSAAGEYWLLRSLTHLTNNGGRPSTSGRPRTLDAATVARFEDALDGRLINLADVAWKMMPDGDEVGFRDNWQSPAHAVDQWKPIQITSHWDGQGFGNLDGWAWYAAEVTIPEDWPQSEYYLCFTGVDDHYRAFVGGVEVGQAGDIATKSTAFEMRTSHALPAEVGPGDKLMIRVAVYDWYGAGGIFRPAYLRTHPLAEGRPVLND